MINRILLVLTRQSRGEKKQQPRPPRLGRLETHDILVSRRTTRFTTESSTVSKVPLRLPFASSSIRLPSSLSIDIENELIRSLSRARVANVIDRFCNEKGARRDAESKSFLVKRGKLPAKWAAAPWKYSPSVMKEEILVMDVFRCVKNDSTCFVKQHHQRDVMISWNVIFTYSQNWALSGVVINHVDRCISH